MAVQTNDRVQAEPAQEATSKGEVARFHPPRLPYHPAIEDRFGVKAAEWKALVEAVFPLAQSVDSVVLALSYCKARKLDPFKRVVHIVPIWDKNKINPNGKKGGYTDTIWPGIGELRTTAFRTKQYAGADACEFGPMTEQVFSSHDEDQNGQPRNRNLTVTFPEWAQLTVYRMIEGQRMPIPGPRVYWRETYARMGRTEIPNEMWQKRPIGQLEKCAEAAALRRAFPEELGDDQTNDETGALIGPDHAQDVTPRPTRESVAIAANSGEPFEITDGDGAVRAFDNPHDAANAFSTLLADTASLATLNGLWESNNLSQQLLDRGFAELADSLHEDYLATAAELNNQQQAALGKDAAAHDKVSAPIAPPRAPTKPSDFPTYVAALKTWLPQAAPDQREAYMTAHAREMAFIAENRTADHDAIMALLDELRQ